MNRSGEFLLRAGAHQDEDEEQLYERQALICDDDGDICDDEIDTGQAAMRHRTQLSRDRPGVANYSYELKSINAKAYRDKIGETGANEFTYYDIQPGDSLQSISLRYSCHINQIKRLNGLMTDQDFYGLRRLKLPLGKLGLLEDVLTQQKNGTQDLLMLDDAGARNSRPRLVNSPGSASSVVDIRNNFRFKPLLSPGYSSDRINESHRFSTYNNYSPSQHSSVSSGLNLLQHNSHSFSSLSELGRADTNMSVNNLPNSSRPRTSNDINLPQRSFIKTDMVPDLSQVTVDNMLIDEQPVVANVFEDLDYHVERAKVAAESYEQRAADIVKGIESSNDYVDYSRPKPSKIPELFFSGENFGLNIKRLVMLIFFVCLVIPLVYISQDNVIR